MVITDPTNKQQKRVFDSLGRLIAVYEPDVDNGNALTVATTYTYSALDKLLAVAQGAQARSFTYDRLGRLMSSTTPEAGTVAFEYNSLSQVTKRTDARGVKTNYIYDLGRLSQISYDVFGTNVPATPGVSYTYGNDSSANNKGRLTTMADGTGSEAYSYDVMGRVTGTAKTITGTPNQTYTLSYEYNRAGDLTKITYPSGLVVNQNYDTVGRLSSLTEGPVAAPTKVYVSDLSYTPSGGVQAYTLGIATGSVSAILNHSPDMLQLSSLTYSRNDSPIFALTYGYTQNNHNNGQITSIIDQLQDGRSATFGYDALYRLRSYSTTGSQSYPALSMSWSYDRYGNRTTQIINGQTQDLSPTPANNQLAGYSYDTAGNMLSDGTYILTWDAGDRLVQYGADVAYKYDGMTCPLIRHV